MSNRSKWWWLVLALTAWWALWAWEPVEEPPGYILMGPFPSREECLAWQARSVARFPGLDPVGCVELDVPGVRLVETERAVEKL